MQGRTETKLVVVMGSGSETVPAGTWEKSIPGAKAEAWGSVRPEQRQRPGEKGLEGEPGPAHVAWCGPMERLQFLLQVLK